jgi:hypothetical protein
VGAKILQRWLWFARPAARVLASKFALFKTLHIT